MTIRDPNLVKENIINFLKLKGPNLPVHIAKEVGMDTLFASAFLSELISNKIVKTSNMRVGTSPLYLLPGQESGLEKFSEYIKGKEYEAFDLLKKNKFLVDSDQEPAIRVALRNIKDFAKSFEKEGGIIWRYFLEEEENYSEVDSPQIEKNSKEKPLKIKEENKSFNIKEKTSQKKKPPKKNSTKKNSKKNDDMFFNKIKEQLFKNKFEILDIVSFNKKDLILRVKKGDEEKIAISYNKKRISEKDILNAHKKAEFLGLKYLILSLGDIPKKVISWIDALKNLESIEKIE
ncbi:hypothetical protein COU58_01655 [Candidatus Pacearchaeota archaeon CG10_big_fil_rev_8_21_14_0_10_32_42]|nr:MAG: hypothetical protein COU58_01655 [Candidatus Pacearchaeota archaeon CG10_big_fil_rev_8_21_14_0_10_32_42]